MTFINEKISEKYKKIYELDKIDEKFSWGLKSRDWTVDKERNIYLRCVKRGIEKSHQSTWAFYWKGELIVFVLENISTSGVAGGVRHGHKRVKEIEIPLCLEGNRDEIINDLKEALTAYKDGGVFSTASSYKLTLDIEM